LLGKASNEKFAQFLVRIYIEIEGCFLANFSKLKNLQAANFSDFRNFFLAKLEKFFVVPADTFDNVPGEFPIGFQIWDTNIKRKFEYINADIYDGKGHFIGQKGFYSYENVKYINDWYRQFYDAKGNEIGILNTRGNDFQNQDRIYISSKNNFNHTSIITSKNLITACIYIVVRHCIPKTWLNDRDQFLYPNDGWKTDYEFQNDCLAFALFHDQNRISAANGINHWIPFIEWDVEAKNNFKSHFMTDFIAGPKHFIVAEAPSLFYNASPGGGGGASSNTGKTLHNKKTALKFSKTAKNVFKAGLELWKYYHAQPKCNVNASLYDIREHFQGRNAQGKMNNKSDDDKYNELIGDLRSALKELAQKIEPKVYEYGFLKG